MRDSTEWQTKNGRGAMWLGAVVLLYVYYERAKLQPEICNSAREIHAEVHLVHFFKNAKISVFRTPLPAEAELGRGTPRGEVAPKAPTQPT